MGASLHGWRPAWSSRPSWGSQLLERSSSTMPLTNKRTLKCASQLTFSHGHYNLAEYILTSIEFVIKPLQKKTLQKASLPILDRSLLWSASNFSYWTFISRTCPFILRIFNPGFYDRTRIQHFIFT